MPYSYPFQGRILTRNCQLIARPVPFRSHLLAPHEYIASADRIFQSLTSENKPHNSRVIIPSSTIRTTFGC